MVGCNFSLGPEYGVATAQDTARGWPPEVRWHQPGSLTAPRQHPLQLWVPFL